MDWDQYLMGFAEHAALKSKDETKVGAVLTKDRSVLITGFNGPPRGVIDKPERFKRDGGIKYRFVAHGEANLISTAAREGVRTDGCDVYCTHFTCSSCARLLIQSGVRRVVYGPGQTSMPAEEFDAAREMFAEAGVEIVALAAAGVRDPK